MYISSCRSEGHLCITPTGEHSISSIIDCIMENRLKYININMIFFITYSSLYVHVHVLYSFINRQRIHVSINGEGLPVLALNEAFIGDTDPSQYEPV